MKEHERALKALANRRRLKIVKILKSRRDASVGELKDQVGPHVLYRLGSSLPPAAAPVVKLV